MYLVTKRFVAGVLEGLTIVDKSPIPYIVGREYDAILTGSRFIIDKVEEVNDELDSTSN